MTFSGTTLDRFLFCSGQFHRVGRIKRKWNSVTQMFSTTLVAPIGIFPKSTAPKILAENIERKKARSMKHMVDLRLEICPNRQGMRGWRFGISSESQKNVPRLSTLVVPLLRKLPPIWQSTSHSFRRFFTIELSWIVFSTPLKHLCVFFVGWIKKSLDVLSILIGTSRILGRTCPFTFHANWISSTSL